MARAFRSTQRFHNARFGDEPDREVWLRMARDLFLREQVDLERFEEMAWAILHDEVPGEFMGGLPAPLGRSLRSGSRAFETETVLG